MGEARNGGAEEEEGRDWKKHDAIVPYLSEARGTLECKVGH